MNKDKLLRYGMIIITVILIIIAFAKVSYTESVDNVEVTKTNFVVVFMILLLCALFFIQVYFMLKPNDELILVDKDEATDFYIHWLETNRKISIPKDFDEHWHDETDKLYRFVFKWKEFDTAEIWYAPIDIFKYYVKNKDGKLIIQLGHGRGKVTNKLVEVETYILRDQKTKETRDQLHVISGEVDRMMNQKLEGYGLKQGDQQSG